TTTDPAGSTRGAGLHPRGGGHATRAAIEAGQGDARGSSRSPRVVPVARHRDGDAPARGPDGIPAPEAVGPGSGRPRPPRGGTPGRRAERPPGGRPLAIGPRSSRPGTLRLWALPRRIDADTG